MFELIEDSPTPGKLSFTHTIRVELDSLHWYNTSEEPRSRVHELSCAVCRDLIGKRRWAYGEGRINGRETRGWVLCEACGVRAEQSGLESWRLLPTTVMLGGCCNKRDEISHAKALHVTDC
jgi:hypothetical protein